MVDGTAIPLCLPSTVYLAGRLTLPSNCCFRFRRLPPNSSERAQGVVSDQKSAYSSQPSPLLHVLRESHTLTLKSHSDPAGDLLDTELPDLLVELWVDSHILCSHCLLRELDDLLDTLWSTLLEGDVVCALVQVDRVLTLVVQKSEAEVYVSINRPAELLGGQALSEEEEQ